MGNAYYVYTKKEVLSFVLCLFHEEMKVGEGQCTY